MPIEKRDPEIQKHSVEKKANCCNHNSCAIAIARGARNGFYYGSRLRFAHAFVM